MRSDPFTDLLDRSAPRTTEVTPDVAAELLHLRIVTESAEAATRTPRWARPVTVGLVSATLVVGMGAAAAASGMWTLPWAEDNSLASFSYRLPSGLECEQRVGGVSGSNPTVVHAVEDFWRTTDIQGLLTDEAIARVLVRHQTAIYVNEDGSTEPAGPGTEHYNADSDYITAVWDVAVTAMDADLERMGLANVDPDLTMQSEPNCPGLEW